MEKTVSRDRSPKWSRVEDLFHAALNQPAAERESWVHEQSELDTAIRDEVMSLLAASQHLEESGSEACVPFDEIESKGERVPPRTGRLGPYRLESLIGSGGMGAVYLARRDDGEYQQKVAIKVMAPHLAGSAFLNTFLKERQVLANLNHPNITRLLDGGVSDDGEPYLVMEYVDGQPLDRFCDVRNLPVSARLRVFLQVCQAVEYAHRNLVVHRDLKPANILVDTEGNIKLLDFGTAKLLDDDTVAATQAGLMTPRYASPEQLRAEPVTTASDVFSLGVILYELLSGAWPFGNPKSAVDELDRMLRGRPASPLAEASAEGAAEHRASTRERLQRELTGDLSNIVLKMLEDEPCRRYGSVRQVAEDLERYRQGRPVLARAQTSWYRARKFVRRNWLGVAAAGLGVLALAGLTAFSLRESMQARAQAARAQRISNFAKNTFLSASSTWTSPLSGQSHAIQFNDILDNAAQRVGVELRSDPLAEAELRGTLGHTYAILGDPVKGEVQMMLAIERLRQTGNGSSRFAADLYLELCDARSFQGRYAQALAACRESLALARVHGTSGPIGGILHDTAFMAVKSGEPLEDAERLYREALLFGPTDEHRAKLWPAVVNSRIGMLRFMLGDFPEGDRLLLDAERDMRAAPGPPIEIITTFNALAFGARVRGRYDEAVHILSDSLDLLTARPTAYLGRDQIELELAADEALAGNRQALSLLRSVQKRLPSKELSTAEQIRTELLTGIVEDRSGLPDSAERHFRSALAASEKGLNRQPATRVEIYVRLAELLATSGKEREAAEVAGRGLATAGTAYGAFFQGHPFVMELQRLRQ